jgi:serine/threonine protein kinase
VQALWFRAPEILVGHSTYSTSIDIWSLGVVFLELMFGRQPLHSSTNSEMWKEWISWIGQPIDSDLWLQTYAKNAPPCSWTFQEPLSLSEVELKECPSKPWSPNWYLFQHQKRYPELDIQQVTKKWPIPRDMATCLNLIRQMLQWDPTHRPTAMECLNHPLFKLVSQIDNNAETAGLNKGDIISLGSQRIASTLKCLEVSSKEAGFDLVSPCMADVMVSLLHRLRYQQNRFANSRKSVTEWKDLSVSADISHILYEKGWFSKLHNNNHSKQQQQPKVNSSAKLLQEEVMFLQACHLAIQQTLVYTRSVFDSCSHLPKHINSMDVDWTDTHDLALSIVSRKLLFHTNQQSNDTTEFEISACVLISLKIHPSNDSFVTFINEEWVLPLSHTPKDCQNVVLAEQKLVEQLNHCIRPKDWLNPNNQIVVSSHASITGY